MSLSLLRTESRPVTGWARWQVLDDGHDQAVIGVVVEDHEWLGGDYGPARFSAAHNPGAKDWGAPGRSDGHRSPKAALRALEGHLAGINAIDAATQGSG